MTLSTTSFSYVCRLVRERSGIVIDESKTYLVETRLAPLAREMGLDGIDDLVRQMRDQPAGRTHRLVVEAMTTNETSFFRDLHPFESLRTELFPELIEARRQRRRLRIWCAACSSGQEPYSLLMLIREGFPELADWTLELIASDISREMIDRAREGVYSQLEVNRGLPAALLVKYFRKDGLAWRIKDELRRAIDFREVNLTRPLSGIADVDLIFARNVMIYFDVPTKREVLQRIRCVLAPDGRLFLGGAETTVGIDDGFEREVHGRTVCYRLAGTPREVVCR